MALTPETLRKHELIGLHVRVVDAANPDLVGIEGEVASETMQMLHVATDGSRVKQVPKQGTTFEFELTDEAAALRKESGTTSEPVADRSPAGNDSVYVTVDGNKLLSRPALRTELTGDSQWR